MDIFSWFPYSIISVIFFGVSMVLYKLPSAKNQSKTATTFWMLSFAFLFSTISFYPYINLIDGRVVLFGFLWGGSFALLAISQMYALSHIDTSVLLPTTSIMSLIIAVTAGFFFFSETISIIQLIGVLLAVFAVYKFIYKKGKLEYSWLLINIGLAIIFMSAFNKIIQKFAADAVDIHALQITQYFFGALLALGIFLYQKYKNTSSHSILPAIKLGLYISIPSFLGGYALLTALTKGPFTLITPIHSTYIFITALLGYFFFKEDLTIRKMILLTLAVLAIILIRIG